MKVFAFISITFVVLIGFGVVYTQWETKNFVQSLPKPQPMSNTPEQKQQGPSDAVPDPLEVSRHLQPEDERSELSVESDSGGSETATSDQGMGTPEVLSTRQAQTRTGAYDWRTDAIRPPAHRPQIDPWRSTAAGKAQSTEGPDITTEQLRAQLVKRFGDIPQVHTFVDLDERYEQGALFTYDEYILYMESAYYLFPLEKTAEAIRTLKSLRRMNPGVTPIMIRED